MSTHLPNQLLNFPAKEMYDSVGQKKINHGITTSNLRVIQNQNTTVDLFLSGVGIYF